VRRGSGFRYLDPSGEPVADAETTERIKSLVIPPAWTEVWICPWPNGHIQATGTDDAGRRQYIYHPRFRALQEAAKHEHVLEFAGALPAARARIAADLEHPGLVRARVLACAAQLLDLGLFRIGSDRYVQANGSYGLTTLLCEHATVQRGGVVEFSYHGKSGKDRSVAVTDPGVRKTVRALLRGRGPQERLLAYRDGRTRHELHAEELNAYLRDLFNMEVSAKDYRTWHATVLAAVGLAVSTQAGEAGASARRRAEARAVREVADHLGNTPAVCRASYINPPRPRTLRAGTHDRRRPRRPGPRYRTRAARHARRYRAGGTAAARATAEIALPQPARQSADEDTASILRFLQAGEARARINGSHDCADERFGSAEPAREHAGAFHAGLAPHRHAATTLRRATRSTWAGTWRPAPDEQRRAARSPPDPGRVRAGGRATAPLPMPMQRWIRAIGTVCPNPRSASHHASVCGYPLSTSVPSTSNTAAALDLPSATTCSLLPSSSRLLLPMTYLIDGLRVSISGGAGCMPARQRGIRSPRVERDPREGRWHHDPDSRRRNGTRA
jgi:DNA topoisomerase IB